VAKERIDFDKLKEAIPGFAFEADIWQLQACLRQSVPSEQSTALKCFEMSVAVMHKCLPGAKVPPNLLSNMSILYLAAGALDNAVQFARRAIVESGQYSGDVRVSESVCSKVFLTEENAFMNAQGAVQVRVVDAEHVVVVAASDDASNSSLPTAGDGILVGGVYMAVEQAEGRELRVTTTVDLPAGDYSAVRVTSGGFVRDDTLTLCFNYARMLEEVGCLAAANEVYGALVDAHPSFAECKMHADFSRFLLMQATRLGFVRMGCINKGSGQYAQAQHWFKRAAEAGDSDALDLQLLVGDVHLRMNEPEKAKHVFEKVTPYLLSSTLKVH
jgi:tetratricopeptide (TPR) repeat protein